MAKQFDSEEPASPAAQTEGTMIPFSDDEEASADGDDDPDEPGLAPDVKKARNKRRGERIGERLRAGEQAKVDAAAARQENAELRDRLARLEGAHVQLASQGATPQVDPIEKRLAEIETERDAQIAAAEAEVLAKKYTVERAAHYKAIGEKLDRERVDLLVEKKLVGRDSQLRAAVQTTVAQNQWQMQYPEIYGNPRALAWATSKHQMELAEGKQQSTELIHQVMAETKKRFNMAPKEKPSASLRSKFSGHPASGASTEAGPAAKGGIVMTKELSRIARAAYPGLPKAEAEKKWAQKTGKRMREAGEL